MLYSTEFEWGSNQLYSLSRQLIGMWSDMHPAEVPPWKPGKVTNTHQYDNVLPQRLRTEKQTSACAAESATMPPN